MKSKELIRNAIANHGIKVDIKDSNIHSLVNYAQHVAYSEGWKDCNLEKSSKLIPDNLPQINYERLKTAQTNCEIACLLLGWQGGTVHQVAEETGFTTMQILASKDIYSLIYGFLKGRNK